MTTTIADVIVPEVFNPYVIEQTMELSALVQSGIVANDADFNDRASAAAWNIKMPFWTDLDGESENIVEGTDLTPAGIGTDKDIAAIIRRAKMWSATDLAAMLAGSDPMAAIASLVGGFWARDMQAELIAVLNGAMGATNMTGNVLDISGNAGLDGVWDGEAFIDASALLGDAKGGLTAVAMHSATETLLEKQDLIQYVRPSEGGAPIAYYMGKRVIIDDGCPVDAGVYTTYLFGAGAVGLGFGSPVGFVPTEIDRDPQKGSGVDFLINRRQFIMHPRGIAFEKALTESPTRAELANSENWNRVFEQKRIRIVQFKHRVA